MKIKINDDILIFHFPTCCYFFEISILVTKTTAAQNESALSYHRLRGLYSLAVVFVRSIIVTRLTTVTLILISVILTVLFSGELAPVFMLQWAILYNSTIVVITVYIIEIINNYYSSMIYIYIYIYIYIRARYYDTHYIATSPTTHSNQYPNLYPNPRQYPKPCPNPNTIAYALIKCCRNIVQSQYSALTIYII